MKVPRSGAAVMVAVLLVGTTGAAAQDQGTQPQIELERLSRSLFGDIWRAKLADTYSYANMDTMPSVKPMFRPDAATYTTDLFAPHPHPVRVSAASPLLSTDPMEFLFRPVRNLEDVLYQDLGTRINLYNVQVWQWASGVIPGAQNHLPVNRFDFRWSTHLWEIEGLGAGRIDAQLRITHLFPGNSAELGADVGSLTTLDSDYTTQLTKIPRLSFQQAFFDNRVFVGVGKCNPNDYYGLNLYASDETSQYLAQIFDGGTAQPAGWQGYMPAVWLQAVPVEGWYVNVIATSPLGASHTAFQSVGDGLWWLGVETGLVTEIGGDALPGRYSIACSTTNTGANTTSTANEVYGNSMTLVAQQAVAKGTGLWVQWTYTEPDLWVAQSEPALGITINDCFGRIGDGFGAAIGWTVPSKLQPGQEDFRTQMTAETYYRLQLSNSTQLTADIEWINQPNDPANTHENAVAFALRLKVQF